MAHRAGEGGIRGRNVSKLPWAGKRGQKGENSTFDERALRWKKTRAGKRGEPGVDALGVRVPIKR